MRFLLLSDIHNNESAVEQLRAQERNRFDALVVAGDIGSDSAQQIFDILATFGCPVLYIYGNWDHKLGYAETFGRNLHHLHLAPFKAGPVSFVGFSGCTAGWGQNPEAQRLDAEVDTAHSEIIERLDALKAEERKAKAVIEADHKAAVDALNATSRRGPSQKKMKALDTARDRKLAELSIPLEEIQKTDAYRRYMDDRASVSTETLAKNRRDLSELVGQMKGEKERLVVVTHDRLGTTQADFPEVPIFLFGHRHGFSDTVYKGARYINVSALDMRRLLRPKQPSRGDGFEVFRNLNVGNYAVLEWTQDSGFQVERIALETVAGWEENWELETAFQMPGAIFLR